jgi:(p)ppGpp synthase/HD superfamily hydrolase
MGGLTMILLEKAQKWAAEGHKGVCRKFGNIPYIVHPEAVVEIVSQFTGDTDVLAAAWLHDIVEDTDKTIDDIRDNFNDVIATLVWEVSKVSGGSPHTRNNRVVMDVMHYGRASKWGKTIKLADAIHNLPTMIRDNKKFAPKYVSEKKFLLHYIEDGNPLLASILYKIIEDYEKKDLTVFDLYSKIKKIKESIRVIL